VQKLRLRYAKRGRLRFTSHRDFGRAFERAVHRAGVPVAYSSGFSPHPRISYANASPTGAASEAEYLEIGVSRECQPVDVRVALDEALPDGLDVLDVVVARGGSLAERLEAALWRVDLPGVDTEAMSGGIEAFLARDHIEVERMTKRGMRSFDCRSAVVRLLMRASGHGGDECARMDMVIRHATPAVRPDDILVGLRELAGLLTPAPPLLTRLAQGPLDPETGDVGDPLEPDRDAPTVGGDR
jgi:radical SAM-linked protein